MLRILKYSSRVPKCIEGIKFHQLFLELAPLIAILCQCLLIKGSIVIGGCLLYVLNIMNYPFVSLDKMVPRKACRIAIACAVLHNIVILLNEPVPEEGEEGNKNDQLPLTPPFVG